MNWKGIFQHVFRLWCVPFRDFVTTLKRVVQEKCGTSKIVLLFNVEYCVWAWKCAMRGRPSVSNQVQLANLTDSSIASVYISKEIISSQFLMALRRMVRVEDCTCPKLLSAIPFWKWTLTLQKSVVWLQAMHALMKPSSSKRPLSPWQCQIVTPCTFEMHSKPILDLIVSSRVKFSKRWQCMKGGLDKRSEKSGQQWWGGC